MERDEKWQKVVSGNDISREKVHANNGIVNGANILCKNHDSSEDQDYYIKINSLDKNISCTIGTKGKLSDYFDRLPYGIIDKKITGIGATTLEMNSPRNSIIVFPTKALAYSKYISKILRDGDGCCMYVGSSIGEISSNIDCSDVRNYLASKGQHKKFFVVADSLYKVLESITKEHYKNYFLMIDEIDSYQSDSTYRPKLENIIDYYGKFPETNRACVSATVREFSHPILKAEPVVIISYAVEPRRCIKLKHTDNEDLVTINIIKSIAENSSDKVLIAYNSLQGIKQCIGILKNMCGNEIGDKIGILCSEQNQDMEHFIRINNDGTLSRQIIFMTCAYFVGIDISDRCHLISVSTSNQPFTLISEEKLTQIAGRCRKGLLSETIVYTSSGKTCDSSISAYRSEILEIANGYLNGIKALENLAKADVKTSGITKMVNSFLEKISVIEISKDYYIHILRNNIDDEKVIFYLNIDALIERYNLYNFIYNTKEALPKLLSQKNDIIEEPEYPEPTVFQKEYLLKIKASKKEKLAAELESIRDMIIKLSSTLSFSCVPSFINEYLKTPNKQVKEYLNRFKKLSPYIDPAYLATRLLECHSDRRLYKGFNNSVIMWALDDSSHLKILFLGKFKYHSIVGKTGRESGISFSFKDTTILMKEIYNDVFLGMHTDDKTVKGLFKCFFKLGNTKKVNRIIGLNPEGHPPVLAKIKEKELAIKLLEL